MASLTFEGETHGEIVQKVKRWLQSVERGEEVTKLTPAEAVEYGLVDEVLVPPRNRPSTIAA